MQAFHIPAAPPLYTSTFLLISDAGNGVIIDPAADAESYNRILKEKGEITDKIPRAKGRKRAKAEKSDVTAKISEDDAGPILEPTITQGAAVASEKAAAVGIPQSVIAACERELVYMQDSIDRLKSQVKQFGKCMDECRNEIENKEAQMKEIREFCRREKGNVT